FDEHRDLVLKEINMIMKMRNEEGYWDITWKWDSYPEDFCLAKERWQSLIAFGYLKMLLLFNKI
ncbi:MAG TPA: hypothetical protein VIK94_03380, partial [Bacilli bacterium]